MRRREAFCNGDQMNQEDDRLFFAAMIAASVLVGGITTLAALQVF
jgi:hypothetical protein